MSFVFIDIKLFIFTFFYHFLDKTIRTVQFF